MSKMNDLEYCHEHDALDGIFVKYLNAPSDAAAALNMRLDMPPQSNQKLKKAMNAPAPWTK